MNAKKLNHHLPNNSCDLEKFGYKEIKHQAPNRRQFFNQTTNETLYFDKGISELTGWKSKDHYHRESGNKKHYLDLNGVPIRKSSEKSHLVPNENILIW